MTEQKMTALLAQLKSQSEWKRWRALKALKNPAAVSALIQLFEDKDEDCSVLGNAVEALGMIGDRRAVPVLIEALTENYGFSQLAAMQALGKIWDRRAVSALSALLDGETRGGITHEYAVEALIKMGSSKAAALALVETGSPEFPALMEFLGEGDQHNAARLKSMSATGFDPVSWDIPSRTMIVKELGGITHPQAVPALLGVLKNKKLGIEMRYLATQALIQRKNPELVLACLEVLQGSMMIIGSATGWFVCREVVEMSPQVGLPALPILVAALTSTDKEMGQSAARALTEIAQHHPDPALRTALPALRRLRSRAPAFQEAWEQIEAVTSTFKNLPVPTAAPPLNVQTLPRPAAAADVPADASRTPASFWRRLCRFEVRKWFLTALTKR